MRKHGPLSINTFWVESTSAGLAELVQRTAGWASMMISSAAVMSLRNSLDLGRQVAVLNLLAGLLTISAVLNPLWVTMRPRS